MTYIPIRDPFRFRVGDIYNGRTVVCVTDKGLYFA